MSKKPLSAGDERGEGWNLLRNQGGVIIYLDMYHKRLMAVLSVVANTLYLVANIYT